MGARRLRASRGPGGGPSVAGPGALPLGEESRDGSPVAREVDGFEGEPAPLGDSQAVVEDREGDEVQAYVGIVECAREAHEALLEAC